MSKIDTSRSFTELRDWVRSKGAHVETNLQGVLTRLRQVQLQLDDKRREVESLHTLLKERDALIKKQRAELTELRKRSENRGHLARISLETLSPENPEALREQVGYFIAEIDEAISRLSK